MTNKYLLIFPALLLFTTFSCKSTVDYKANAKLKGSWIIESVEPKSSKLSVKGFDGQNITCYEGSNWNFIPNNNTGNFALSSSNGCYATQSNITWYITPQQDFIMKLVDQGVKAKTIRTGLTYKIENISESYFSLVQRVPFESEFIRVVYHFRKSQ